MHAIARCACLTGFRSSHPADRQQGLEQRRDRFVDLLILAFRRVLLELFLNVFGERIRDGRQVVVQHDRAPCVVLLEALGVGPRIVLGAGRRSRKDHHDGGRADNASRNHDCSRRSVLFSVSVMP